VEDRDEKTGTDPEIEAHRRRIKLKATDEGPVEDSDDDVEAHRTTTAARATDEPGSDDSDDVELHRKNQR
jgi:hypothetical protein